MGESLVVADIRAALGQRRDFKLLRINSGLFKTTGRPVRTISVNGFPDTFGVLELVPDIGVFVGIEAKDDDGEQSDDQLTAESIIASLGGIYFVARSGAEALAGLERARAEKLEALRRWAIDTGLRAPGG